MKRIAFAICCCIMLLSASPAGLTQDKKSNSPTAAPEASAPLKHGGKIETKYDGFNHETVVTLRKMSVTCGAGKGFEGAFKDTCVSFVVSLHCPGKQLDYVRRATLQLIFESKDWDSRHPLGARDLVVIADGETLRLGTMELVRQGVDGGLLDERAKEILEVSIPFQTFGKIARAQSVEVKVGRTAFELKEKNVAALRDLSSRVRL